MKKRAPRDRSTIFRIELDTWGHQFIFQLGGFKWEISYLPADFAEFPTSCLQVGPFIWIKYHNRDRRYA